MNPLGELFNQYVRAWIHHFQNLHRVGWSFWWWGVCCWPIIPNWNCERSVNEKYLNEYICKTKMIKHWWTHWCHSFRGAILTSLVLAEILGEMLAYSGNLFIKDDILSTWVRILLVATAAAFIYSYFPDTPLSLIKRKKFEVKASIRNYQFRYLVLFLNWMSDIGSRRLHPVV